MAEHWRTGLVICYRQRARLPTCAVPVWSMLNAPEQASAVSSRACEVSQALAEKPQADDLEPEIDIVRDLARALAERRRFNAGEMTDDRKTGGVGEEKLAGLMGEDVILAGNVLCAEDRVLFELMLFEKLVVRFA